jgi:hypothetical protein
VSIGCLAANIEIALDFDERPQSFADDIVVVGKHDA